MLIPCPFFAGSKISRTLEAVPLWQMSWAVLEEWHSFHGSFFSGNHQKPTGEADPVFEKNRWLKRMGNQPLEKWVFLGV